MQYCGSTVRCTLIVKWNLWTGVPVWLVAALGWCKPQGVSCLGSGGIPHVLSVYQYSQQQHTVFTSTHSHLSPVNSLDVLRVTVLLCVQSYTHRRLWNREGHLAKLSTDRGVPVVWSWKKYLQYQKQLQNQGKQDKGEHGINYQGPALWKGVGRHFGLVVLGSTMFLELQNNQVTLKPKIIISY